MKRKRIRITRPLRVRAIELLAEQFNVGYNQAFAAYNAAKEYCKVFNDKTVLEETEYIILQQNASRLQKVS